MIKIGDKVKIINNGYLYSTSILAAMKLDADVCDNVADYFVKSGYYDIDLITALYKDTKCKWKYNRSIHDGEVCILKNMDEHNYLVERIHDGSEFVIGKKGVEIVERVEMFNDEYFLV